MSIYSTTSSTSYVNKYINFYLRNHKYNTSEGSKLMNIKRKKTLWGEIKEILNEEKKVKKYTFVNRLIRDTYYDKYVNNRRTIKSVYWYVSLLKKAGYIRSTNRYYHLIMEIPINLTIKEAKLGLGGFFKEEDFKI